MWHVYYYVPPCPKCGSYETGHYIKKAFMNDGLAVEESLKHGEIAIEMQSIPKKNCFCETCGYTWHGTVSAQIIGAKELAKQRELRKTDQRYEEYMLDHYPGGKKPKDPLYKRWLM